MVAVGHDDDDEEEEGLVCTAARVFFDLVDENTGPLCIDKGVSFLMARVRLEWRRGYPRVGCMARVSTKGELQMVSCEVMPFQGDSANLASMTGMSTNEEDDDATGWAAGEFETGTLIKVEHGAKFKATFCFLGVSVESMNEQIELVFLLC